VVERTAVIAAVVNAISVRNMYRTTLSPLSCPALNAYSNAVSAGTLYNLLYHSGTPKMSLRN